MTSSSVRSPFGPVVFVGAGPGDPGLLTRRGAELLAAAHVVVVDEVAARGELMELVPSGAVIVHSGHGEHGEHGEELTRAGRARRLVALAGDLREDQLLVRLVDGDPAFFGGFAEEATALAQAGIGFSLVPGVSAVSAVPGYAGVPLVASGGPEVRGAYVVSVCGASTPNWAPSLAEGVTTVLLGVPEQLRVALGQLATAGLDPATPLALTTDGTSGRQLTRVGTLGQAGSLFEGEDPPVFPTLAVLGQTVSMREALSWFESRPLHGWQVLVPQTKGHAGALVGRLQAYGAATQVVQTINVEPPRTPHAMDRAISGLVTGRYEWIGFTSVNAVKAVRERLVGVGLDARAFAGLKVAAVGAEVVAALRAWGIEPDLVAHDDRSVAGLLEDWPDFDPVLDPINRVLLPRADIATDTLVAGLAELGWEVDDVTAYRTVRAAPPAAAVREAIKSGSYDAVVFTSSSTVRNLIGIAGKPAPGTLVACIGPKSARTAQEHGLRVDILAPEATVESLVDALADHGATMAEQTEPGQPRMRPSRQRPARRRSR